MADRRKEIAVRLKPFTRNTALAALLCGCLIAQPPAAKKPSKKDEPVGVQVAIDAIVTGAAGKVVPGLTAKDFEILQEQQKQKIVEVKFVESKAGALASAPAGGLVRWAGMELSAEERTMIVVVVDDMGLSPNGRNHVRSALSGFVNEKLRSGEFVAIIPTSGGPVKLQQFSSDKSKLQAAIAAIPFQPGSGAAAVSALSAQAAARRAVLSLQTALRGLVAIPGRKSVVFFSENMWLFANPQVLDWFGGFDEYGLKQRRVEGEIRTNLTATANLASVVFYAADPRSINPAVTGKAADTQIDMFGGLGRLTKETGGVFFDNTNDAARVLERVEQELSGYYKIVFTSSTKNESGSLPFLRPTVKVLQPGANVRARTGMLKVKDETEGFDPGQALTEMIGSVASPFSFGEIGLGLRAVFSRSARNELAVDILLPIEMKDISYTLQKDGMHNCTVEVATALINQTGTAASSAPKGFEIKLKPEEYERVLRNGLPMQARLYAPSPGNYQVVAAVRDLTSGKVGSIRTFVDVPNISTGQLNVSGVMVSSGNPVSNFDMTPEGRAGKEPRPMLAPIRTGKELNYSYQVFNATLGEDKRARLDAAVKLYRNGLLIHDGELSPLIFATTAGIMRLTVSGKVHFKESMPSGEYSLQVIVKDKLVQDSEAAIATQHLNFTVLE